MDREEIAKSLFGGKCFVCHKKFGKRFTFHHLFYLKREKQWKDFKNRDDYYKYLHPKIIKQPDRFLLLCNICHWRIDKKRGGLKRMKSDKLVRLFVASLLSKND